VDGLAAQIVESVRSHDGHIEITSARQHDAPANGAEYYQIYDEAPVMIWVAGLDKQCKYANKKWLEFRGRPLQEESGDRWSEGVHPQDLEQIRVVFDKAFSQRQPFQLEYRIRRFDGEYRWILCTGEPHHDANGEFAGYIGSCVDVTDQKRTEQDLKDNTSRLHFLLELTSALPWVADLASWRFTYVGPQASRFLGYPPTAWLEKDFWVNHVYQEDRSAAVAFCQEHSLSDTDYEFDYRMVAADGRLVWVHDIVNVVRENGVPTTLRGLLMDITARRTAEDELRDLREQIARVGRIALMGQLTASIAHEVNQPLCAIVSNVRAVQQMMSSEEVPEEVREAMEDIAREGQRASDLITRMRKLFQRSATSDEPVNINDLIREVIALMRSELEHRCVALKLELADGLQPVFGDGVQLQQLIMNLLTNAIESMQHVPRDRRELSIRTTRDGASGITVAIRDSGIGIDATVGEHVFDAFFTTKPAGMGMGLAICKSIVTTHGGRLWLQPNKSRGMTFLFSLPTKKGNGS
jgi:PAS domain S-box-containing protein